MDHDLRSIIRSVVSEELALLRAKPGTTAGAAPRIQIREEVVSISTNAELAAFVTRLLEITQDGRSRQEIESGNWVFTLNPGTPAPTTGRPIGGSSERPVRFDQGLVSERQIAALPHLTKSVQTGKRVRFTPLALDELRRRDIVIERMGQ